MIGHRIWVEAKKNFQGVVIGTTRANSKRLKEFSCFSPDDQIFELDVSDWNSVQLFLDKEKPDWIVNAAGITIRKDEIKNLERAFEVNSLFPRRLEKWCEKNQKQLIHLSTDCVFGGESGNYTEESVYSAKDIYGKSKALGEVYGPQALTLRFSCIGRELEGKTELLEWFLSQEGKEISGFNKVIYTGVTNLVIAREVLKNIKREKKLSGIYQVSSKSISKYHLLELAKRSFGINTIIKMNDGLISDKSLDSTKYKNATGFVAPSWEEMMAELAGGER